MADAKAHKPQGGWAADLAMEKLTRVVGAERARAAYQRTLAAAGLTALTDADDLHRFGRRLAESKGFEAGVGGLLMVAAVLRGARGT